MGPRGATAAVLSAALAAAACGCVASRTRLAPVYGDVRVEVGSREVPTSTGSRIEPVYATRRQIVGARQVEVGPPSTDTRFHLGTSLEYRVVPSIGVMEWLVSAGIFVATPAVEHLVTLRLAFPVAIDCPNGSGGGGRVTYAARFRIGQAYVGPELGLGANAIKCEAEPRTTIFVEILGVGVVAGYGVGNWRIGGSARVGFGQGDLYGPGYILDSTLEADWRSSMTVSIVFGVETSYEF
jgi:hypothetical protein